MKTSENYNNKMDQKNLLKIRFDEYFPLQSSTKMREETICLKCLKLYFCCCFFFEKKIKAL